jgi:putative membrane protein
MPIAESDPRVFFAAERTLLAWLRTGLTIIAIGFMVARFGLFVRLLSLQGPSHAGGAAASTSAGLGVLFTVVGSLTILVAAIQHGRFVATLSGPDLPPAYSRKIAVFLSLLVAALGFVLSGYLVVTPN